MKYKKASKISPDHPRYESLQLRARMVEAHKLGILAESGLIAHGRGEAFDYLIGEKTTQPAIKSTEAAAASLILADHPVISVNGNTAALVSGGIVSMAGKLDAKLEINLFYRTPERVKVIEKLLKDAGAEDVLGTEAENPVFIKGLEGPRSRSSREGVYQADVVLVPLEDGDRAEALVAQGKWVITVDLNPLSRTSKTANVTIIDNLVRVIPHLIDEVDRLKNLEETELRDIVNNFDNQQNIRDSLKLVARSYVGED